MKGNLTQILLKLAARECGVATSDLELKGYTTTQVGQQANRMVEAGRLFKAKFTHRSVRWYTDAGRAEHAVANHVKSSRQVGGNRVNVDRLDDYRSFKRMAAAGEMVITEKTIFTQCPNYVPRFQAVDLPGLYAGNQRGRVTA